MEAVALASMTELIEEATHSAAPGKILRWLELALAKVHCVAEFVAIDVTSAVRQCLAATEKYLGTIGSGQATCVGCTTSRLDFLVEDTTGQSAPHLLERWY